MCMTRKKIMRRPIFKRVIQLSILIIHDSLNITDRYEIDQIYSENMSKKTMDDDELCHITKSCINSFQIPTT